MYAPRVFVSMIGALTVFAVVTYFLNGSLTSTLIQTAICAVLIQIGYFLAVVFLIWRKARERGKKRLKCCNRPMTTSRAAIATAWTGPVTSIVDRTAGQACLAILQKNRL